ncbi:MAG: flagellin lysine-N-methylase [Acetivibrio ethanolgignens]
MKILMPFYYQQFKCIGDSCPDTCCKDWKIPIDVKAWDKYQKLEGSLGKKVRESISTENGISFKLEKDGSCPLLNQEKLCELVLQMGEDFLCTTCATYPRFSRLNGDVGECGLSLSCPEVARILLSIKEPIDFCFSDNGEEISLNPQIDYSLYNDLLTARRISIDIAQNRNLEIWERLFVLCMFNQKIQNTLSDSKISDRSHILCQYDRIEYIEQMVLEVQRISFSEEEQFKVRLNLAECFWNNFSGQLGVYKNIFEKHTKKQTEEEIIRKYVRAGKEFSVYYKVRSHEYENFIVYWLFRYYMQSVGDKVLYKNIEMLVLVYTVMRFLALWQWLDNGKELTIQNQEQIFWKCSRSIEHDSKSYDELHHALVDAELNNIGYMLLLCKD